MVRMCQVCRKYDSSNPAVSFHRFPTDPEKRKIWFSLVGIDEEMPLPKSPEICSEHFDPNDIHVKGNGLRYIKPGANPTLYISDFWDSSSSSCDSYELDTPPNELLGNPSVKTEQPSVEETPSSSLKSETVDFIYMEENVIDLTSEQNREISFTDLSKRSEPVQSEKTCKEAMSSSLTTPDDENTKDKKGDFVNHNFKQFCDPKLPTRREESIKTEYQSKECLPYSSATASEDNDVNGMEEHLMGNDSQHQFCDIEHPKKRKRRYVGDMEPSDFSTPEKRKKNLTIIKTTITNHRKEIHSLQMTVRRLRLKVETLETVLKYLEKTLISESSDSAMKGLEASFSGSAKDIFERMLKLT